MTLEGLIAVGYTVVLAYLWTDHLWHAFVTLRQFRDARSFRTFLIAAMVAMGAATLLVGAVARFIEPGLIDLARFVGDMTRGALLVVGFLVWLSRHRPMVRDEPDDPTRDPRVPR